MTYKEWKRRVAYEMLVILGVMALLTFIFRLWPILLLLLLGIFITAIRLLFLSSQSVKETKPLPALPEPKEEPTERDVQSMAYSIILRRVSELVLQEYPDARWVWENCDAQKRIIAGEDVFILLNHAGGYRRAKVQIVNLRVVGIVYQTMPPVDVPIPESDEDEEESEETPVGEPLPENYELLAFEWVETHLMDLNSRCNEAIGLEQSELILSADELPVQESWPDICRELQRNDLEDVQCIPEGIKINLTQ